MSIHKTPIRVDIRQHDGVCDDNGKKLKVKDINNDEGFDYPVCVKFGADLTKGATHES